MGAGASAGPKRGRPVSLQSRTAAISAAAALLADAGWPEFSIDEVARRSGVGKATIYRHWAGAFPLAVEAWGDLVTEAVPTVSTGRVEDDLLDQVARLADFYASADGIVAVQLIGASVAQPGGGEIIARAFFGARRAATRDLVRAGMDAGHLRDDLDPDVVIDLLFGPIVFRLFNGLGALDGRAARASAELAMRSITCC
ncbi:TetR/AcrR family transcriptional regulator C-terminal ligand-binding domain-containing protein [Curtobacterium sp. L3-7]|uniref:TetR/AcrR family transcriptional regulator n=1 Tax=Curtobacterium sp. L3-7 TaxID=3138787 RepID=UPI003B52088C